MCVREREKEREGIRECECVYERYCACKREIVCGGGCESVCMLVQYECVMENVCLCL